MIRGSTTTVFWARLGFAFLTLAAIGVQLYQSLVVVLGRRCRLRLENRTPGQRF